MQFRYVVALIILCSPTLFSQSWIQRYARQNALLEEVQTLLPGPSGSSIVAGSSFGNASGWDVTLLSYDAAGNQLWGPVHYNGDANSDDKATCAARDASGNICVGGMTWSDSTGWDYLLVKFGPTGQFQWARRFGEAGGDDDLAGGIVVDGNGGIVLTGRSRSASGFWKVVTVKYDGAGNLLWTRSTDPAAAYSVLPGGIALDASGNVYVGGNAGGPTRDILLLKYSPGGAPLWSKRFNRTGNGADVVQAMGLDGAGNVILAGSSMPGFGPYNALLMKVAPDGSALWTKTWLQPGKSETRAQSIQIDAAGDISIAAKSLGTPSGYDIAVATFDAAGTMLRESSYSGNGSGQDRNPPLFAGVTSAVRRAGGVNVAWADALDDQTERQDLRYIVCVGTAPGGENFNAPAKLVTGEISALLDNLQPDTDYYIVVRSRDAAGNTDRNVREFHIRTPAVVNDLIVTRDTLLGGGVHCYGRVIVEAGATLRFSGDATLCATDSIVVAGEILADCFGLTLRSGGLLRITGRVDDRCVGGDPANPGSIFLFSGTHAFAFDSTGPRSGIYSRGFVTMTNDSAFDTWKLALPRFAKSSVPLDPVGSVTADVARAGTAGPFGVSFTLKGLDPNGGPVSFDLDFGDGSSQNDLRPADGMSLDLYKTYAGPGSYPVVLTVRNAGGGSSVSTLRIFLADTSNAGTGTGVAIDPDNILIRQGYYSAFHAVVGAGGLSPGDSLHWDFGDGGSSTLSDPAHAYALPGRYHVVLNGFDGSGHAAAADMYLYAYKPDTTKIRSSEHSAGGYRKGPAPAALDFVLNFPIVGSKGQNFYVNDPNLVVTLNPPPGGGVIGAPVGNGERGTSFHASFDGKIEIQGGVFAPGNGGNGMNGRRGGNGGNMTFEAHDIKISGGVFIGASGGDGASDTQTGGPGQSVTATGKAGGKSGAINFAAGNSIDISGPISIVMGNGGDGGAANATGGDGTAQCPTGQAGGSATATGGKGGAANTTGAMAGNVAGTANITISGGQGGNGGDATANGGKGGDAINCDSRATGGAGGSAAATAGDGGKSGYDGNVAGIAIAPGSFTAGDGGDATATGGDGGKADPLAKPLVGKDGCPGENGGDATAVGGNGGKSTAKEGQGGTSPQGAGIAGNSVENGSRGGDASAVGGDGGNGVGCKCDGGKGGKADATGGTKGALGGKAKNSNTARNVDGDADAIGGNGGKGGSCCNPPGQGGAGGDGGNATVKSNGATSGNGGNGGDGGDGCPPGAGGAKGTGTGGAPKIPDGNPGQVGQNCCPPPKGCLFGIPSFADGEIPSGTIYTWGIYNLAKTTKLATVDMHFLTPQEFGQPTSYVFLSGNNDIGIGKGGMSFDCTTLKDVQNAQTTWLCTGASFQFQGQGTGTFTIQGLKGGTVIAQQSFAIQPTNTASITAPNGQYFDTLLITTTGPILFDIWWLGGLFIDP